MRNIIRIAEIVDTSVGVDHPFIGFHGSVSVQIITLSIPFLPSGGFCTILVKIPLAGFFHPSRLYSSFYRLRRQHRSRVHCDRSRKQHRAGHSYSCNFLCVFLHVILLSIKICLLSYFILLYQKSQYLILLNDIVREKGKKYETIKRKSKHYTR